MKKYTNLEICEMMITYFASGCSGIDFEQFGTKENEVREIFAIADRDWGKLPCNSEGFTPEQDKEAHESLEIAANEVLSILKN